MIKLATLILFVLSINLASAQTTTWEHLPNYNGNLFKKCSMFNNGSAKGFAIITNGSGLNSIVKTNDGGLSWGAPLILPSNISDLLDLAFFDDLLGFISVRINSSPALESKIYKTIDGGITWLDVSPSDLAVGTGIADIYMLPNNANQVFHVTGDKYHVSTDAGATWNSYTFSGGFYPTSINFSDSLHGIVGGWDGTFLYSGAIYTTNNGGLSWDSLVLTEAYSLIKSVLIQNSINYYALSSGQPFAATPKLFYSDNAGTTWDTIPLYFLDTIGSPALQIIDGTVGNELYVLPEAPGNIYHSAVPNGNYRSNGHLWCFF